MSKLTESFRSIRVFNPHDFYATRRGQAYIEYTTADRGRGGRSAYWAVYGVGFDTNPDGHWRDYGRKTFPVYSREDKASQLEAAQEWAARYGITDWAKDPYGGWGDAEFVKQRVAELKAQVKQAANAEG